MDNYTENFAEMLMEMLDDSDNRTDFLIEQDMKLMDVTAERDRLREALSMSLYIHSFRINGNTSEGTPCSPSEAYEAAKQALKGER